MWKAILLMSLFLFSASIIASQSPVLVIPTGHSSGVHTVSASADGKYFLTAGGDNLIKLWNNKGQELRTYKSEYRDYRQVYLSPDGSQILAVFCTESMDAWILDVMTGKKLFTLKGQKKPLSTAKYSPDSKTIASATEDGRLNLWDAKSGKLLRQWKAHKAAIVSLDFSPDSKYVATLSEDGFSKVWDAETGTETRSFETPGEALQHIRFSPDGKVLSIGTNFSGNGIALWSVETGKKMASTDGYDCIFSPDGAFVAVFGYTGAVILPVNNLNAQPLQKLAVPLFPTDGPMIIAKLEGQFLPDGNSILLNSGYIPVVLDYRTGKQKCAFKGYSEPVQCVSFLQEGNRCLFGSGFDIVEWDLNLGKSIKRLAGHTAKVCQAKYVPDGQKIVSVANDYTARIWDAKSGDTLGSAPMGIGVYPVQPFASILAIAPDGQYFVKGHSQGLSQETPILSLWNLKDVSLKGMMWDGGSVRVSLNDLAFSPDGKWLAALEADAIFLWDMGSNKLVWQHKPEISPTFKAIAFSTDGSQLATNTSSGLVQFWDASTGKLIAEYSLDQEKIDNPYAKDVLWLAIHGQAKNWFSEIVFSQNGKWMATTDQDKLIRIWDVQSHRPIQTLYGHDNSVTSLDFSPDSRWLISASEDNTVRFWDFRKGEEAAKLVQLKDNNWAVTTPSGLFDASDDAKKMMYHVVDYKDEKIVLDLEQIQERYWQPGLLGAILGLSPYPVRDVGVFDKLQLFPSIDDSTRIESDHIHIKLRERNGGLGKLTLRINGIVRNADLNPLPQRKTVLDIDLNNYSRYFHADTLNTIELEAYESKDKLKSDAYQLYYQASVKKRGEGASKEGSEVNNCLDSRHLYLIVVGTSLYPQGVDSLPSANDDAIEMARVLSAAGKQLYDERVHLTLLSSKGGKSPSKTNIAAAFEAYKDSANLCDVLVVFFAGHGKNWGADGDKSNFYYLTKDITFGKLEDAGIRKAYAISDKELEEWMGEIRAENKLLILDACNSGQAAINMGGIISRDMDPDKIVAFNLMSGNTGSYVISGSSESGVSFESAVFGHGLLTYSLLEGINGTALEGSKVDVLPLLLKSFKRVEELAQSLGQEQTPIIAKPRGNASFFMGKNDGSIKIELLESKPMVIRSFLFDQDAYNDPLGLTKSVNAAFRSKEVRGKQAPWFFSDISEHPQGFSVRGTYSLNRDKTVTVKGGLLKGEDPVGEPFELSGIKDLKELTNLILNKVKPLIKVK